MFFSFLLSLVCFSFVQSIPIDNGLEGEPEVLCGSQSMLINFNTQATFEGQVYVKNHYTDSGCKGTSDGQRASIELDFNSCGVVRERSLQPAGVYISAVVVVGFHPTFLTKIDRAIRIQCFYMEADKTVSQELEVSMLTTLLQTVLVPMPTCRYEILDGGPSGDPVRFTIIGQQVYHKWTCDTDTTDVFCMVVYDCKVNDGSGDEILLLDQEGCALDEYLLGNLEYPTDLMAGREAHVFKYADRPNLYFNCQIRLTVKEPGEQCPLPSCATGGGGGGARAQPAPAAPSGGAAEAPAANGGAEEEAEGAGEGEETSEGARRKRTAREKGGAVLDVFTPFGLMVADVDLTEEDIPAAILHPNLRSPVRPISQEGVCVGQSALGIGMAVAGFVLFVLCVACTGALVYRNRKV